MLAEKGDYACATSSASSKLIHGGLRYLEHFEFGLVRESLVERAQLLRAAPHLVAPLRFLLPVYRWQRRQALTLRAALALYDTLSFGDGLPASGRLDDDDIVQLPRLRQEELVSVLHYCDCMADDARLTLAVLLDARVRGADIRNRRAVTAIAALENGYAVELDERARTGAARACFVADAEPRVPIERDDAISSGCRSASPRCRRSRPGSRWVPRPPSSRRRGSTVHRSSHHRRPGGSARSRCSP